MEPKNSITLTKGCLIIFEGIDGTGKSTQLKLLNEALLSKGYDVVTTREPTNGRFGKKIRELYINRGNVSREEELELFIQDREEHVEVFLAPMLSKKKIILCDRYYLSTIAYQGAAGMNVRMIEEKNAFAPTPDIALLFQLSPRTSIQRITQKRGDELNDFEQEDSLQAVEKIFNSLSYPFIQKIDAEHSVENIHGSVLNLVEGYLAGLRESQ